MLGDQPRLQHEPKPEANVRLLAGEFGGAGDGHALEGHGGAAGAHDLLLREAGVGQERAGKLLGQMLGAAGVERIGHEAGIVEAGERDAVAGEHHHVELGVLHDLEHALVFKQRLEQVERLARLHLLDLALAAEVEPVAHPMAERDIDGGSWTERKRDADELALHGVRRCDLSAEGDMALLARRIEQRGKPLRVDHRLVFAAVEGKRGEHGGTLFGEMHRRAFLRRINRLGPLGDEASRRQFAQRVVVDLAAFARLLGRRRGTGGSLDAEAIGDAAKQGAELQPAHEAQQRLCLRLAHQSLGERHV